MKKKILYFKKYFSSSNSNNLTILKEITNQTLLFQKCFYEFNRSFKNHFDDDDDRGI